MRSKLTTKSTHRSETHTKMDRRSPFVSSVHISVHLDASFGHNSPFSAVEGLIFLKFSCFPWRSVRMPVPEVDRLESINTRPHHDVLFIFSVIHRPCQLARCFMISNQLSVSQLGTFQLVCNLIILSKASWECSRW